MAVADCNSKVDAQGREITRHGSTAFPAACYYDRLAWERVPWHWHEEWEAVMVERGLAAFSVDGQEYLLCPGEGIFVNASALHSVWDGGNTDCRLHSIVFHPRLVGGGPESVFWQSYVHPLVSNTGLKGMPLSPNVSWNREALGCIQEAWNACASERPGYELETRAALSRLAFLLVTHCPTGGGRPGGKAPRKSERIKVMLQYVQDHYQEPLTTEAIAKSASVSASECLRCFREMLGTTPIQYVRQLRVQRAAELLKTTRLKIAEIGAACGFQEMSYFAKTFRQTKHCTPKEYRSTIGEPLGENAPQANGKDRQR